MGGAVIVRGFRADGKPVFVPAHLVREAIIEDKPKSK